MITDPDSQVDLRLGTTFPSLEFARKWIDDWSVRTMSPLIKARLSRSRVNIMLELVTTLKLTKPTHQPTCHI